MEIDDKILQDVMNRFGITKEMALKALKGMIDDGLLQENSDPSVPMQFKLTPDGSRLAEKTIIDEHGEFRKVTDHNGVSYKVPVIVILREGIKEEDLNQFPLWVDEK